MTRQLYNAVRGAAVALAVAISAVVGSVAEGLGQALTPVAQDRDIGAFVIVPPCGSDSDSSVAPDFGLFDDEVFVKLACDDSFGSAFAEQTSSIATTSILARGATESEAMSIHSNVIHAISNSTCDITFDLDAQRSFDLTGVISAAGQAPVVLGGASVRLLRGDGGIVFEQGVEPGNDGELVSEDVCAHGILQAGRYRLQVSAATVIDSTVPPSGSGTSQFDITFVVGAPAAWDDFDVVHGTHVAGDLSDLLDSDNEYLIANSMFGFTANEPNIVTIDVAGNTLETAEELHCTIEAHINHPAGSGRMLLFDHDAGRFVSIGAFPMGPQDRCITIPHVDSSRFVEDDGGMIVRLRASVLATFSATGFRWHGDRLGVLAD